MPPWGYVAHIKIKTATFIRDGWEQVMADEIREFTVRLPVEDHRMLKVHCALTGESMNQIVVDLVHNYLAGEARQDAFDAALSKTQADYREALDRLAK
jgi:hypothetical protein